MTEIYKALRVPISLLHQKVYPTSHRLPKWEGIILDKKGAIVPQKIDVSRVISPCAGSICAPVVEAPLFEGFPYLRRFFSYMDAKQKVECRLCGEQAVDKTEREEHLPCYKALSLTLKRLVKDGLCVVCEKQIDKTKVNNYYNDIPICDDNCMQAWEWYTPDVFQFELEVVKTELLLQSVEKSTNSIRQFFGPNADEEYRV